MLRQIVKKQDAAVDMPQANLRITVCPDHDPFTVQPHFTDRPVRVIIDIHRFFIRHLVQIDILT